MARAKTSASENAAATGRSESYPLGMARDRRRVSIVFPSETKTEQHHKAACDINNIMARYTKTGVLEHVRRFEPVYADVSADDYHESMNKVAAAKTLFEELPSAVRRHFGDDVSQFLHYCDATDNAAQGLQDIAEEYRRQSLGLDEPQTGTQDTARTAGLPGRDAGSAPAQDGGMDAPSEGAAAAQSQQNND